MGADDFRRAQTFNILTGRLKRLRKTQSPEEATTTGAEARTDLT